MGLLDNTTQAEYYENNNYGNYQFTSLDDIITQFMFAYVGENKIISKIKRIDVAFHAQRAMQELSFDTFKSFKAQEITVPSSLQMILPQDYVNYTKISWSDSAGIKHRLYPTTCKTSNPTKPQVDSDNDFLFDSDGNLIPSGELITNGNFMGGSEGWELNQTEWLSGGVAVSGSSAQPIQTSTATPTHGDPERGWFYGFDGNAVRAYDVLQYQGIMQSNIPIKAGEEYKVTYTLSGYTSGSWFLFITDENGDYTSMTQATANGTYSETLTAGTTDANRTQGVYFRNESSTNGNVILDNISIVRVGDEETSKTWGNYKSATPSENQDDYQDDTYWPAGGERYGLDPQHAQANGSFYIDQQSGKIHFSSNISGKTVVLDYISDGLGTDAEMQVHKFAEEAMYKSILCAIMSAKANVGGRQLAYYKKDKFAATRTAKLRLSNLKIEELTQILRGKSKHIKH